MTETAIATNEDRSINAFSSADAFSTAQRMAKALSSSTLVPAEYRGNIPNTIIAMELAARIETSPFMVMQNLDVIHGKPSFRSTFLIATVNACGRFTPLRFRFEGQVNTQTWGCRAYAKDREADEECLGALITIGMAKSEGWTSKKGSKWLTMPEQMLMYRAAAFWTRVYAPELSLGMHTREEQEDVAAQVVRGPSMLEQKLLQIHQPSQVTDDPQAVEIVGVEETDAPDPAQEPEPVEHDEETGEVYGANIDGE
jgi:hypothetical protein